MRTLEICTHIILTLYLLFETCRLWRVHRRRRRIQAQRVAPGSVGIQAGGDIAISDLVLRKPHNAPFPKFYQKLTDNRRTTTTP